MEKNIPLLVVRSRDDLLLPHADFFLRSHFLLAHTEERHDGCVFFRGFAGGVVVFGVEDVVKVWTVESGLFWDRSVGR